MWKKLGYYDSLSDEKRTRYIFSMAQCENSGTVIITVIITVLFHMKMSVFENDR